MGKDNSINLDASIWNGSVELSLSVINNIPLDYVIFGIFFEQIYLLSL